MRPRRWKRATRRAPLRSCRTPPHAPPSAAPSTCPAPADRLRTQQGPGWGGRVCRRGSPPALHLLMGGVPSPWEGAFHLFMGWEGCLPPTLPHQPSTSSSTPPRVPPFPAPRAPSSHHVGLGGACCQHVAEWGYERGREGAGRVAASGPGPPCCSPASLAWLSLGSRRTSPKRGHSLSQSTSGMARRPLRLSTGWLSRISPATDTQIPHMWLSNRVAGGRRELPWPPMLPM